MKKRPFPALSAMVFAALCSSLSPAPPAQGQESPDQGPSAEVLAPLSRLEREKVETTNPERLMDALGIRPGMSILDIGAGTGQWSYAFASRLQGQGAVFATEIDPLKVLFIEKEAGRRGLAGVHPVLVSTEGVDPFYAQHRYDVIFLSHVYYYVKDAEGYFAALGNFLKDDGRLVIIVLRHKPYLALDDITDFEGLLVKLAEDQGENPFYRRLESSTQSLIGGHSGGEPAPALREAVVRDLNAMLYLPRFYEKFPPERLSFTAEEERHYRWLLGFVRENMSYDGRKMPFEDEEEHRITQYGRLVRLMNRMVIFQHFREYLAEASLTDARLDGIIAHRLGGEGYALKESLDLHPFNFILVFVKK